MPDILEDSFRKLIDRIDEDGDFDADGIAELRSIFFAGAQAVIAVVETAESDEMAAAAVEAIDREIDAHLAELAREFPETLQ
ncbi:hypothetical protein [Sinorhizobium americanum]|uniref:Uncharacterized protein n=1 Tax=Sinorhizobium americanum TaxID=194963 RepID=A0A4R2BRH0_9HYPH|nr:hypothetical protein [Sinorhizobium americanum]TCN30298.1 hypothetical protein EV184_108172 [Sinorhizobium americanum]